MREQLITAKDVAALTGLSVATLSKWRTAGVGPTHHKLGRRVRYSPQTVDAWIQARVRQSTTDSAVQ